MADALTQLRAALEHDLYAEVEARLGRLLTNEEAVRIEMPACSSADVWEKWLKNGKRLAVGAAAGRIDVGGADRTASAVPPA
ncbi:hypothetical protein [Embleya sp. AB8]|uniref:hypothetical protein n=1 Tax=Embleya sp. AB8 TaxID=3156304 RepID=UPI003C71D708